MAGRLTMGNLIRDLQPRVDIEAEYDDRGPRMRVSKTLNVRWK